MSRLIIWGDYVGTARGPHNEIRRAVNRNGAAFTWPQ